MFTKSDGILDYMIGKDFDQPFIAANGMLLRCKMMHDGTRIPIEIISLQKMVDILKELNCKATGEVKV